MHQARLTDGSGNASDGTLCRVATLSVRRQEWKLRQLAGVVARRCVRPAEAGECHSAREREWKAFGNVGSREHAQTPSTFAIWKQLHRGRTAAVGGRLQAGAAAAGGVDLGFGAGRLTR